MLHDVVHPAVDRRRFGPQRLTVGELVGHEPVIEAHVDAVGLVDGLVEPHMLRGIPGARGRQGRGPADGSSLGVEGAQSHQRVDDDDVGSRL